MTKGKCIDFIGLGCTRSGTTWVLENIAEHPQICIPRERELCYFGKNPSMGFITNWDRSEDWLDHVFAHCELGQIKGELNTLYLPDATSPALIKERAPDAKMIVVFRNPTDRLLSLYYMMDRISGMRMPFESFIEERKDIVETGCYHTLLTRFTGLFPLSQFHFILFDDIETKPKKVISDLFCFLEVDADFVPSFLDQRINVGGLGSSRLLSTLVGLFGKALRGTWLGRRLARLLYDLGVYGMARRASGKSGEKAYPGMSQETRAMLNERYSEEIVALGRLLNRDLSHWLEPSCSK